MPKCKCGRKWLWDWDMDSYRYADNGKYVNEKVWGQSPDSDTQVTLYYCSCGRMNSMVVVCDCGATPVSCPKWNKVNWELPQNSYPEGLLKKKE